MKKIYYPLVALGLCLSVASCSDKLDIDQHGVLNYDTYYQTDKEIESGITAVYMTMRNSNKNNDLDLLTDDYYTGGMLGGSDHASSIRRLNEFTFDASEGEIEGWFKQYYTLIFKSNIIINHVDPQKSLEAARAVAEGKVFRAYSYFMLTTLWGNPPIVDHELAQDEYDQPNASTEDLYAFMEKDLTEAINSGALSEKSSVNDKDVWRLTKQFAQAMLGKVYLWENKYTEAAQQFDAIVASGKYDLFDGPYGDLWTRKYKYNCESMFETNRVPDAANVWDNFNFWTLTSWCFQCLNFNPSTNPLVDSGEGLITPTRDLYNAFVKEEGKDGYRLNQTLRTYEQIESQFGMTVKTPFINDGLFQWKHRLLKEDQGVQSNYYYSADHIWMRYAEVLLCGAEAHLMAEGEGSAKALEYINKVRTRAKVQPLTKVTLDDIKLEKRLELCGEGLRYQDLLRWGDAAKVLANNGKEYPVLQENGTVVYKSTNNTEYGFKAGKHEYLPYPLTEMNLNHNLKQNPNY